MSTIEILLYLSLGALGGILASCIAGGIAAWIRNRSSTGFVRPGIPTPPPPLWTVTRTTKRYGNLPPTEKPHGPH